MMYNMYKPCCKNRQKLSNISYKLPRYFNLKYVTNIGMVIIFPLFFQLDIVREHHDSSCSITSHFYELAMFIHSFIHSLVIYFYSFHSCRSCDDPTHRLAWTE